MRSAAGRRSWDSGEAAEGGGGGVACTRGRDVSPEKWVTPPVRGGGSSGGSRRRRI